MPPNPSVPDIPPDWAVQEAQHTPYVLGIASGDTAWRPVVVLDAVEDEAGSLVTADNNRPVYID